MTSDPPKKISMKEFMGEKPKTSSGKPPAAKPSGRPLTMDEFMGESSFQQPPSPQKSPQEVGGGGGLPTGQGMSLAPSAPATSPEKIAGRSNLFRGYWSAEKQASELRQEYEDALGSQQEMGGAISSGKMNAILSNLASRWESVRVPVQRMKGAFDKEIDDVVRGASSLDLTMDRDGIPFVDPSKVYAAASGLARQYGMGGDEDFERHLQNRLTAQAEVKLIEADATRRAEEKYAPIRERTGRAMDSLFKTDDIEAARAREFSKKANESLSAELSAAAAHINEQYVAGVAASKEALARQEQQYEQAAKAIQEQANSGMMPVDQAQRSLDALTEEMNGAITAANDRNSLLYAQAQKQFSSLNARYNRRFEEENRRIMEGAQARIKAAAERFDKEFGDTPEGRQAYMDMRDATNLAWNEAAAARGSKIEATAKGRFDAISDTYFPISAMVVRFGESVVQGLGGAFKGIGTTLGDPGAVLAGEEMERAFVLGEAKSDRFADLLDASNFSQISGQLVGGMAPSLAVSSAVAAATGGAGVPAIVPMLASGAAGWGAETMQIAGDMRDRVFRDTGSREKADKAAWDTWKAQVQLAPAYAFEGLPFVGKALDFIPSRVARAGVASGTEYGTELLQEVPQTIAEENILAGRSPYEDVGKRLAEMSDSGELKRLLVTMAPISLLGAGGQLVAKGPASRLQDSVTSYLAKNEVAKYAEGASAQWLNSMIEARGDNFATAVIQGLLGGGQIDQSKATELLLQKDKVNAYRNEADRLRLSLRGDRDAYVGLSSMRDAMLKKAESLPDGMEKTILSKRASDLERSLMDFAMQGRRDYVRITYADGTTTLMDKTGAMRMLNSPDFVNEMARQGDGISIDFQGEGSSELVSGFAQAVADAQEQMKIVSPKEPELTIDGLTPADAEKKAEVDSDAIAIAVNDIAASIEDGKKYGVMSGDGSVVDEQQTFDIIDLDYGRIRALAEKGRLTTNALAKTSWGRAISSADLGRIANVLNNKPELVDKVFSGIDGRINSRATKPSNQDNPHTNEGGQVQETPGGLGGTTATQEGIQGEVSQGGTEGQGVAPVAAVSSLSKESLKEAFGYSDEVADATIAIADAMGLDKTKIKVVEGGEASPEALFQQEMDGGKVGETMLLAEHDDGDGVFQQAGTLRWKVEGSDETYATEAEAEAAYRKKLGNAQPSFDITPQMRAEVQKGLPLMQDNKGSVEFIQGGEAVIRALKNPDASTGIHELAHVARRFLFDTSIPQENRQGITDEHIKVAEQWSGAKDGNWTREAEEKFARGFERYLRDGNAPTEALKGVFEKFAQWLREIYQNLFTSPVKELVSPEMRKVFDALVQRGARKEAVAQEDGAKDEVVDTPPAPPVSESGATEQSGNFAERATTQKLIKAFPQYADVFTENAINYDRIPHIQSAEEAKALVETIGVDRLANDIFGDAPMPGHLVSSVAPYIVQEYANRGDADAIALFTEKFAEKMTDAGQMISALNVTYDILANTPGGILMKVARTVEKNRQRQEEQAKKRTDKLAKELGGINKAGISEALKTNKVRTKIAKASEHQPKTPDDEPSWGAKNKLVTKKKYGEALKAMRGRLASGPITPEMITIAAFHIEAGAREFADVAARVVKTLGKKSLPYLKEAYKQAAKEFGIEPSSNEVIDNYLWEQSAKPIVAKLEKAIKAKDAKAQKEAIGELQSISKESGLWGQYKKQAADRLAMLSEQQIRKDISEDPILAEFTRGLIQNISAQVRELGEQKEQKKAKKQTSISIIADAFKNPEKYKEAWDASREKVRKGVSSAMAEMTKARDSGDEARIKKAKDRLEKAQNMAEALDNYFGEFSPKPFSDAAIKSAVRDGMKSLEQKISDIATSHYSVQSSERGRLIDKLMKDAGLSEAEAKELSDAIGEEFDRLVTEKKRSLMKSIFSSKQRKKAEVKALEEKVIRMTNLGAFSNDDIVKAYGDAMGFSKLTEENIETIEGLANAIQEAPEGRPKYDAIQDLLNYEATLRGITPWEIADAVFMANILSGPWTHIKNITAAGFNIALEYLVSSTQEFMKGNPRGAVDLASHLVAGLGHGVNEALSVLKTGRSQVRNRKVEAMSVLELLDKSPSEAQRRIGRTLMPHRFVGRALGAEDTLLHEGAREMRAYKWALNKARKQRDPSMSLRQQALEIMNVSDAARQEAISVAQWELEDKINELDLELERGVMTQKEYNKAVSLARLNYKRRIVEKMESLRPADLRNEAARFGSEATLNSKPYGAMGLVSDLVSSLVRRAPVARRIIPFVNTLSNQANNTLNYTPIGALRAVSPGGSTIGWINRKTGGEVKGVEQKMDEEQLAQWKEDVLTKSIIGTTLAAAIYALAIGDDDEEDPWFSVTGDGYGDPRKNVELQRLGWQPYSFKFGKTYVSYQTSPMMLTMGFVGNMFDAERYQKKQPQDSDYHNFATALASVPSIFASQSYLSGIEKTLSAALSPRNDDKVSDLSDFLLKSAKSQVEPSIYGEAFRIYQNLSGTANIDTRNSYFGQIVKNWPMARDMYPKQYNFMGEPVIPNITQVVTVANSDPAATLSMKNNYVPVSESRATLSGMDPVTGKERLMTDKEADTYYQTRGKEYAKWLRDNYPYLNKLSKKEFQEEASREWMKAGAYAREAAGF